MPALFFVLTISASWILWTPMLMWLRARGRLGADDVEEPLSGLPIWVGVAWFIGAWAPSLVGILLTARSDDHNAVSDLFARLFDWDVGIWWNVVAFAGPMVAGLIGVAVLVGRSGGVKVAIKRFPLIPLALVTALPFGPLGEELGWRGYALPELLTERGALTSAFIIGGAWTLWHVPLFWAPMGTTISGSRVTARAAGRYLLEVMALSVVMTWLFVNTSGSLWIAVAFHAAWNAEMHRFFFAPLSDEATSRVSRSVLVVVVGTALLLAVWPGLLQ